MKIYIAGPITGVDNYKQPFEQTEKKYQDAGHSVMSPAVLNEGFTHAEYMHVCYAMIDVCNAIAFLPGWKNSKGARMEHDYGVIKEKMIMYLEG